MQYLPRCRQVADDLPKNIATAKARGWHGVVFEHPAQATRDLKALGLTF